MKHRKRKNKRLIKELMCAFEHTDRMKRNARLARQVRQS